MGWRRLAVYRSATKKFRRRLCSSRCFSKAAEFEQIDVVLITQRTRLGSHLCGVGGQRLARPTSNSGTLIRLVKEIY
jgi:hypothetical protein